VENQKLSGFLLEQNLIIDTSWEKRRKSNDKDKLDQLKQFLHDDTEESVLLVVVVNSSKERVQVFNVIPFHCDKNKIEN